MSKQPAKFFQSLRASAPVRLPGSPLGGVCAGIAQRYGYSATLVRGVVILLGLMGIGLVLYGLAWALFPDSRDGRIHIEDLFNGEPTSGLAGAVVMFILGLGGGGLGSIFGFFPLTGSFWLTRGEYSTYVPTGLPSGFAPILMLMMASLVYLGLLIWVSVEFYRGNTGRSFRIIGVCAGIGLSIVAIVFFLGLIVGFPEHRNNMFIALAGIGLTMIILGALFAALVLGVLALIRPRPGQGTHELPPWAQFAPGAPTTSSATTNEGAYMSEKPGDDRPQNDSENASATTESADAPTEEEAASAETSSPQDATQTAPTAPGEWGNPNPQWNQTPTTPAPQWNQAPAARAPQPLVPKRQPAGFPIWGVMLGVILLLWAGLAGAYVNGLIDNFALNIYGVAGTTIILGLGVLTAALARRATTGLQVAAWVFTGVVCIPILFVLPLIPENMVNRDRDHFFGQIGSFTTTTGESTDIALGELYLDGCNAPAPAGTETNISVGIGSISMCISDDYPTVLEIDHGIGDVSLSRGGSEAEAPWYRVKNGKVSPLQNTSWNGFGTDKLIIANTQKIAKAHHINVDLGVGEVNIDPAPKGSIQREIDGTAPAPTDSYGTDPEKLQEIQKQVDQQMQQMNTQVSELQKQVEEMKRLAAENPGKDGDKYREKLQEYQEKIREVVNEANDRIQEFYNNSKDF